MASKVILRNQHGIFEITHKNLHRPLTCSAWLSAILHSIEEGRAQTGYIIQLTANYPLRIQQVRNIRLPRRQSANAGQYGLRRRIPALAVNGIINPAPSTVVGNQTCLLQYLQMPGQGRVRDSQHSCKLAYAQFLLMKEHMQDAQSHRIGHSLQG